MALADHVAQAISRLEEGLPIYNSMLWETKAAYPQEFAIALEVLSIVHRELGRKLPLDEAGFVTLHLVNAGVVHAPEQGVTLSGALRDVIAIVADDLGIAVDGSSAAGVRFITHLKFVIKRVTRNQAYNDAFDTFFRTLREQHEPVYHCAARIAGYLDDSFDAAVTEAERIYLMLHLLKLQEEHHLGTFADLPADVPTDPPANTSADLPKETT